MTDGKSGGLPSLSRNRRDARVSKVGLVMLIRFAGRPCPASSDDEIVAQIGLSRVALGLPFGHRRADAVTAGVTTRSSAP
jgi:hypothetical protein